MRFIYQAKDMIGSLKSGELTCESHEAATMQLRQQGLYVVSLEEAVESSGLPRASIFAKPITRRDIVEFASQLAVMVDAGVPIVTSLEGLIGQTDNPSMKAMITVLHDGVHAGEDFSVALSKQTKYFDKAFVNLVKASEASFVGQRDMVLAVTINGESVAYPVRQMAYHHVVHDRIEGVPIVVTY